MPNERLKAAARRVDLRTKIERAADSTRLFIDSLSDPVYQPVAELGRRYASAERSAGTRSRWAAMRPVLDELHPETAADIGCNAGWFTLELARLGIAALGVEAHPPYYRAAIAAAQRSGLRNLGIMTGELTPDTMGLLPTVDCMMFLSMWHHIVREHGLDAATGFTQTLWRHTDKVMFFETGEPEEFEGTDYRLPEMLPDAETWLTTYLTSTCQDANVVQLGVHPSGPGSPATRNLFAVKQAGRPVDERSS